MKFLTFVISCLAFTSGLAAVLPSEFTLKIGPQGPTLTWSSETVPVRVDGSRYEFLVANGTLLGYPTEQQGELHLPLSSTQLQILAGNETSLEVWSSGRRIDADAPVTRLYPAAAAAAAAASAAPTPTVATDPAKKGIYKTQRTSYNVSAIDIKDFYVPIEVVGEVTYPKNAPGKRPLVLFLHGRHFTCYQGGPDGEATLEWPCQDGYLPIPSHKGYRYIADLLATQGYIVVSISANAINAYDNDYYYTGVGPIDYGMEARSTLIRHHLSLWVKWNADGGDPWGSIFKGRLDLNRVVLVGQDRGGEGVHRAAIDASPSDPYKIVGLVGVGPTAFGRQVTPDVHSATILSTCDGALVDLQGQAYVDASRDIAYSEALRSAVIAVGANRNFFNTEWTPGLAVAPAYDDWEEEDHPICGSQGGSERLTAKEQRTVGAAYIAALIKLAVYQDANMLPLLDGSFVKPSIIGRAEVATSAVGGSKYRLLYRPEDSGRPVLRNGMKGQECLGPWSWWSSSSIPICGDGYVFSPHWLYFNSRPSPQALEMQWNQSQGAIAQFRVLAALRNMTSLDSLDVRIANDPENSGVSFDLMVADDRGRNATLLTNLTTIEGWAMRRVHARTLRGSLSSVKSKINLGRVATVFLVAKSVAGRVWVLDIAASRARIQVPTVLNLPMLSLETTTVSETDGPQQYSLNIISDRPLAAKGSVWIEKMDSYPPSGYQLDLKPSNSLVVGQIVIDHVGDDLFSPYSVTHGFFLEAIKGVVTGEFIGVLTIKDDEPAPVLSITATDVTAIEGQSLTWFFELSTPTAGTYLYGSIIAPPSGATELTSGDVPTSWLNSAGAGTITSSSIPLSQLGLYMSVDFDYGTQSAKLSIPVSKDNRAEGDEVVYVELYNDIDPDNSQTIFLTGTVLAHT